MSSSDSDHSPGWHPPKARSSASLLPPLPRRNSEVSSKVDVQQCEVVRCRNGFSCCKLDTPEESTASHGERLNPRSRRTPPGTTPLVTVLDVALRQSGLCSLTPWPFAALVPTTAQRLRHGRVAERPHLNRSRPTIERRTNQSRL